MLTLNVWVRMILLWVACFIPNIAATQSTLPQISAGSYHTCALLTDASVKCWGQSVYGQTGYGVAMSIPDPSKLSAINVGGAASQVEAGAYHTCALLVNGYAKCWGLNNNGQLGYGNTVNILSPSVVGFLNVGGSIKRIAAGNSHTCALLTNNSITCWGSGFYGQLGTGMSSNVYSAGAGRMLDMGGNVSQVVAGMHHTCALLVNGSMKCWGSGMYGETGYGAAINIFDPNYVGYVPVGGPVQQITATAHTCALLVHGSMKCWGFSQYGQLGYGINASVFSPTSVGYVNVGGNVSQVVAGGQHTCALLSNSSMKCWGEGGWYALGYNSITDLAAPTDIVPLNGSIVSVSAGFVHTCVVMQTGTVMCSGFNDYGQLGYNSSGRHPFQFAVTLTSPSPTVNPTMSVSATVTVTRTSSTTGTTSGSGTPGITSNSTATESLTGSMTYTSTVTPLATGSSTFSSSYSGTGTAMPSLSPTASGSGTSTLSVSSSISVTPLQSPSATYTITHTSEVTPSLTPFASHTRPTANVTTSPSMFSTPETTFSSSISMSVSPVMTGTCTATGAPSVDGSTSQSAATTTASTHSHSPSISATSTHAIPLDAGDGAAAGTGVDAGTPHYPTWVVILTATGIAAVACASTFMVLRMVTKWLEGRAQSSPSSRNPGSQGCNKAPLDIEEASPLWHATSRNRGAY